MLRDQRSLACAAAVLVLAACGEARDLAETPDVPPGTPLAIEPVASTSIGVVEGDTLRELHRVRTPFLLPDGNIAVPLGQAGTIRIFSPAGDFIRALGRKGGGPGELEFLLAAWARGDTIEGLDLDLRRITRFLPDGSTEDVTIVSDQPDFSGTPGPLPDGWALWGVEAGEAGMRDVMVARHIARTGEDLGEIARWEGMARYAADRYRGPEPLSAQAAAAIHDGRVYVGEGMSPVIRVFDAGGAFERQIAWTPAPAPDPGETFRLVVDTAVARAAPEGQSAVRRRLEAAPAPVQVPVFVTFLVDELGFLWIRPYEPLRHAMAFGGRVGPGGEWLILSPDGEQVGTVVMLSDLEPSQITRDAVVGIARDEMDVESVRVHRLRRR